MFGLKRNKSTTSTQFAGERASYKQVAVTPKAHARLVELAGKRNKSIIETVNDLLDV